MSEQKKQLIPRPWDKPLVWNPNVDIAGIEPRDITEQVAGEGVQIVGGFGKSEADKAESPKDGK